MHSARTPPAREPSSPIGFALPPLREWRWGSGGSLWLLALGACTNADLDALQDATTERDAAANTVRLDAGFVRPDGGNSCALPDAARERTFYVDADHDGLGVPGSGGFSDCLERAPTGYSLDGTDCDDTDPGRQVRRSPDSDGDGYGDALRKACVGSSTPGYVDATGDCDDTTAARSPIAVELIGDGIDQDCDDSDALRGCVAAPSVDPSQYATRDVVAFPDLSMVPFARREGCTSADLYFAVLGACPVCSGGELTVVVGNRGSEAAMFSVADGTNLVLSQTPLAPQTFSAPILLTIPSPDALVEIDTLSGMVDCTPTDNIGYVDVGFVDCFL